MAMEFLEPATLQVVGGFLLLAALFVLRELASGALKEAGKDLWIWARQLLKHQPARRELNDSAGTGEHSETGRRRSEHIGLSVEDDRSSYLLPLGRGEANTAATRGPAL